MGRVPNAQISVMRSSERIDRSVLSWFGHIERVFVGSQLVGGLIP